MIGPLHDRVRALVLEGDPDVDLVVGHLDECPTCADLAARVSAVRRVAPQMLGVRRVPAGVADRTIEALRDRGRGPSPFSAALLPRVAVAAVVLAIAGVVLQSGMLPQRPAEALADSVLASAQETAATGSARLRLTGTSTTTAGTPQSVGFTGVGAISDNRVHYRALARLGDALVPCELLAIGPDAWSRRPDGSWMRVREPIGALGPVVLDAGSVLELLRLPKHDLRLVDQTDDVQRVAFTVTARPSLRYDVVAEFGRRDRVLRRVDIDTSSGGWRTTASMELYGFGAPVSIHAPAAADVSGWWDEREATDGAPAHDVARALFPVG